MSNWGWFKKNGKPKVTVYSEQYMYRAMKWENKGLDPSRDGRGVEEHRDANY